MSNLKKIKWVGESDKFVPPYGVFHYGDIKEMPALEADEFIRQGRAVEETSKAKPVIKPTSTLED